MKRTKVLISISVIVVATFAMGAVAADKPATAKPAERSAEQKVLDRFLGNWQGTKIAHKAKWHPKETRGTITFSVTRILGGRFTQDKSETSDGMTGLSLVTYDAQRKRYLMWFFNSHGFTMEYTGKWDAKTKTMTRLTDLPGGTTTTKTRAVDNDTFEWSTILKDKDGKVILWMKGKTTRAKKPAKKKGR